MDEASENFALQRGRKGQERQFAAGARPTLEAEGLDPKDYGLAELPAPPPEPPLDDLDALAAYMEEQMAGMEGQEQTLQAKADEAKARAREAFAEMGKDYDAEMAKAEKEGSGPPKFSAVEHLTALSMMAADAAADGAPVEDMEQMLADPRLLGGHESPGRTAPRHVPQASATSSPRHLPWIRSPPSASARSFSSRSTRVRVWGNATLPAPIWRP